MTVIVQISDTHFGTEVPEVVKALEQAITPLQPDIIILSGDITQRARPKQFEAARTFVNGLPGRARYVIPGNHDIPLYNLVARAINPYAHYRHVFGVREGVWCHDMVGVIGYDATSPWRHTRGKLSPRTLIAHIDRARSQLKPGAILVACVHQPLVTAWPEDRDEALMNAEATARLFSEQGVDIVLSGHVHVPLITTTSTAFPGLGRHFILSGAGTAVSSRTRPTAPNSFNVIRIAPASISVTLMEYGRETQQFIAMPSRSFHLQEEGWITV